MSHFMTGDVLKLMIPVVAFMVCIYDGIVTWALRAAMIIGFIFGMAAYYIYGNDVSKMLTTMVMVFCGVYLVLYLYYIKKFGTIRAQQEEKIRQEFEAEQAAKNDRVGTNKKNAKKKKNK
jgi:phosphotransferase system  glucose/maltose/N-acetylglucosamine-specific IIC component